MKKILIIFFLSFSLTLLVFEVHRLTRAQQPPPQEPEPAVKEEVSEGDTKCALRMVPFMEDRRREFGEFINTHFRSKLPTSTLVPVAIERLRQYRAEIIEELAGITLSPDQTLSASNTQLPKCQALIDDDFKIMKEMLRDHIVTNAFAKKSQRLLDGMKSINDKLADLNFAIAQMYGYFGSFSQKLPCYATQCVKQ